jgi:hypothetical protein
MKPTRWFDIYIKHDPTARDSKAVRQYARNLCRKMKKQKAKKEKVQRWKDRS